MTLQTVNSNDNSDMKIFVENYLNLLKVEKKLIKKDIINTEKVCILRILNEENFNKILGKLCNSCSIKGLPKIIKGDSNTDFVPKNISGNNDDNDDDDDDDEVEDDDDNDDDCEDGGDTDNINHKEKSVLKSFNTLTFNNNKCFINMFLEYKVINRMVLNNIIFPPEELNLDVINTIMNYDNIIINLDLPLDKCIKQLAFILIYIGYYINAITTYYITNNIERKIKSIKIKSVDVDNIKTAIEFIKKCLNLDSKDTINIDSHEIIKDIKEKKVIDEKIKDYFGGTKLNIILKRKNIKNISKSKMQNTHNFLKEYLDKCYVNDNYSNDSDERSPICEFNKILNILTMLCKTDKSPPASIVLEKLDTIVIIKKDNKQITNGDGDDDDDDNNENLNFLFSGGGDNSERQISKSFFKEASEELVKVVFHDLFLHNIDKIKGEKINVIIHSVNVNSDVDHKIIEKIFEALKKILLKSYNINNIKPKPHRNSMIYEFYSLKKIGSKRKLNDLEEEIEVGKKEAQKIMKEKKKKAEKKIDK